MPTPSSTRTRSWAGTSAAERRAKRRAQLVEAAFALLGTEGWTGTTVRAVCAGARLNPRYFYESFPGLDALVVAVYDRVVHDLGTQVIAALEAAAPDARARVRASVETTVRFVDEDRRRARVLYVEALGNEALNRRRVETGHSLISFTEEQIGSLAAAVLVGGFSELLMAWLDGRVPITRERLIDDATELFLALGDAAATLAAKEN